MSRWLRPAWSATMPVDEGRATVGLRDGDGGIGYVDLSYVVERSATVMAGWLSLVIPLRERSTTTLIFDVPVTIHGALVQRVRFETSSVDEALDEAERWCFV